MKRQGVRYGIFVCCLLIVAMQGTALDFELIQGKITCNMLRRAYEGVWYQPQCLPDGSFQNPQYFEQGFSFYCCVNDKLPPMVSEAWLGECARYSSKPKYKPTCKQGRIIRNETN